ncbi:hypothetical protein [Pontibacter diazotrophicus]|uniref:hypothetical protein n=1 Tax=Pontibacter diazotrophicus TaxID=1400979 RepID=UPI0015F1B3C6|nr:hypothetical protein [Pontibacter diazotrophicus]
MVNDTPLPRRVGRDLSTHQPEDETGQAELVMNIHPANPSNLENPDSDKMGTIEQVAT